MNTFRKYVYSMFDIFLATGHRAWRDDRFFTIAAGDDGVTFGNE
jgi:hypothetical protein